MERVLAVGVQCDNMVTLLGIADRAGVSHEAARLWASGQRGPGGFPKPVLVTTGGESVWDWEQVARWIKRYRKVSAATTEAPWLAHIRILVTADRVLAARDALRSEPDKAVRQEFERLLEDA